MGFSVEWENSYKSGSHRSIWPWSDVVSIVRRFCKDIVPGKRVLELGVGAGANISFFQWLGVEFYGVDGSLSTIQKLRLAYPELSEKLVVSDFTREIPIGGKFDLILDRASLTHNATADIKNAINLIHERLNPGGYYLGVDWFSTEYSEYRKGIQAEDHYTRTGFTEGPFANLGRVHFSDQNHLLELFKNFELLFLEHTTKEYRISVNYHQLHFASWNLLAKKQNEST